MSDRGSVPTIVFSNLPPKTFVGVNLASFSSSPNFHGITKLPQGLHLVYTGLDASLSIRHGRFLKLHRSSPDQQVSILRWNNDLESLDLLAPNHELAVQVKQSVASQKGHGLVDYDALISATSQLQEEQSKTSDDELAARETNQHELWAQLVSHISDRLLNRILSAGNRDVSDNGNSLAWILSSISSAPSDTEHIPGLSQQETQSVLEPSSTLALLPIDLKQTWPETAVGRDRTEKARDRSWYLSHLIEWLSAGSTESHEIDKQAAAREILGELQFCFIMVLTLANYSCLEQWKRIMTVLLTCETALSEVEEYFAQTFKVLKVQLGRVEDVEGGLFELGDEQNSAWLRKLLRTFRRNVDEAFGGKQSTLSTELAGLETFLKEQYGWEDEKNLLRKGMVQLEDGEMVEMQMADMDEEDETGEYAPTIVES